MKALFEGITIEQAVKLVKPPKRKDVIKEFVEKLNDEIVSENQKNKYVKGYVPRKEWKPAYIAFRLSHLKVDDLFYFLSVCKQAKSFGKCFWWNLKGAVDK
jgi:hypothetical protein